MLVYKVYKHADTYDTKCKICDQNEIRNEFTELMFTPMMEDLRKLTEFATIIIRKCQ